MSRTLLRLTVIGVMTLALALFFPLVGLFQLPVQASGGQGFVVIGNSNDLRSRRASLHL